MQSTIKAIPTHYYRDGQLRGFFRSRIEARWAAFMDDMGTRWVYETEGLDLGNGRWYLPDFFLPDLDIFMEVKGVFPLNSEDVEKVMITALLFKPVLLVTQFDQQGVLIFPCDQNEHRTDGETHGHYQYVEHGECPLCGGWCFTPSEDQHQEAPIYEPGKVICSRRASHPSTTTNIRLKPGVDVCSGVKFQAAVAQANANRFEHPRTQRGRGARK